jgi:hypothetical protein
MSPKIWYWGVAKFHCFSVLTVWPTSFSVYRVFTELYMVEFVGSARDDTECMYCSVIFTSRSNCNGGRVYVDESGVAVAEPSWV